MEKDEDQNEMKGETEEFLDYQPRDPVEWEIPIMYDMVLPLKLEWPSLTVEWLPDRKEPPGKDYSVQKMILGTDAEENGPNYLMLVQVQQPLDDDKFESDKQKVQIIQQINHEGKVNRARYMPQNQCIIATKTISAEVYVFDYSKHPAKAPIDGKCNPDLRLRGHNVKGSGLS
ncbi:Chromatin assembly complex, subunit 3 [Castilleja foliolosa]|uniref:Chromatin assembly complex, subunit 3 n=1 Tax=Castilleja foliolosa TaxID=1961234 RepID=A0ABD3D2M9_9LAMI